MSEIHYLDHDNAVILMPDSGSAITVSFSDRGVSQGRIQKISYKGSTKTGENIRLWGKRNDLPQYREQVVSDNNIVGTLIQTKRDIILGTGLYAYRMEFKSDEGKRNIVEVPIPDEAKAFFDRIDIDAVLSMAVKELLFHGNIFMEYIRQNDQKIYSLKVQECKYTRLGEQNSMGKVENAFISGSWATGEYSKDGETDFDKAVIKVPMYNPDKKQPKFILHLGDSLLNDGYYNSPAWWAAKSWIELANNIPVFHQSNIMNGYTPRFHISMPKDYFKSGPPQGEGIDMTEWHKKANDEETRRRSEFMDHMNNMLAGKDRVGRAIFSTFSVNEAIGKEYPGIKIEAITVDIKDEAMLKLFEKSNQAVISSQGIHPTLANVDTQGKLSSGSEMRNAYNVFLATKTYIPRRIILKAIELVKKINGWDPDIYFDFQNTELVTLDESPTGTQDNVVTDPSA